MVTISLIGAEFFAYHGFYPEEQKLGSRFIVDAEVSFIPVANLGDDELTNTVNYERLYLLIAKQMAQTKKLIETVAQAIADDIKVQYHFTNNIKVSIRKLNPPLKGKVEYSCVTIII